MKKRYNKTYNCVTQPEMKGRDASMDRTYIAIDLKSFYASVECVESGLDPLTTNLVVADYSRTEKTICLAVSPSLKSYGVPGRARLFEVVQKVKQINAERLRRAPGHVFTGESADDNEVRSNPSLKLGYRVATPRMACYMEYSTRIVEIYLKYVSMEDIHVYSVDEVFIDATAYLKERHCSAREFAEKIIRDVLETTGITATVGIGSNLYLAKIAMDIYAKHFPADSSGTRIAELDEMSYRKVLWDHRPLTDFWRVGKGIAEKLEANGMYTMGDVARCSIGTGYHSEDLLHKLFGINAELLIDHAWGWEPCTIADIRNCRAEEKSISVGQVLSEAAGFDRAKMILREMTDGLVLDLVRKKLNCDQIVLTVGYDMESLKNYHGETEEDRYGRLIPRQAHGSVNLGSATSSTRLIMDKSMGLFDRIVSRDLLVRRMYIVANNVTEENGQLHEQLDLFSLLEAEENNRENAERERKLQEAMLKIKEKHGKNAILHGTSYQEGATGRERNRQIGGHRQ